MSARDDYPTLSGPDAVAALRELDLLRTDVTRLLAKLNQAETWLRIATAKDVSLWTPSPNAE